MPAEITWETIGPMVVKKEAHDAVMMFTFECPVTGQQTVGGGLMKAGMARALGKNMVANTLKQSLFRRFRNWILTLVGGGAGAQMAASVATEAATSAADGAAPEVKTKHSDAEVQAAAVNAFEKLVEQQQMVWSQTHESYASATGLAIADAQAAGRAAAAKAAAEAAQS